VTPTPRESPTQALYRAALGPVQSEHHLRAFDRFDAVGEASPSWNWAAALFTLNWLLYRRLWRMAGLYLLLVLGAGGVLWGLAWGRLPDGVSLGLAAAACVVATVLPGLYANAWLHGQLRLALVKAASEAPSLTDACELLQHRAPSLARLGALVLFNLLLAALVINAAWRGPRPAATLAATVTQAARLQVAQVAQVAPPPPASSPAPAPAPTPERVPAAATTGVLEPPPRPEPPERPAQSVSEPIAVPAARGYGINIGLFADPANAQRSLLRIRQAGLPARSDTLQLERGLRTRVRAGPFASRAEADQAADRIRALGLEAQLFRQDGRE
jgi:cell division septation protein DedD